MIATTLAYAFCGLDAWACRHIPLPQVFRLNQWALWTILASVELCALEYIVICHQPIFNVLPTMVIALPIFGGLPLFCSFIYRRGRSEAI